MLANKHIRKIKLEDIATYSKHFSEASFREKVRSVASLLGQNMLLPVLQAYYVLRSPSTPTSKKLFSMGLS